MSCSRRWADKVRAYYPLDYQPWAYFYQARRYLYITPWVDGKGHKSLIEVGTGTCLAPISAKLMHPWKRVVAVDSEPGVVELAKQRCHRWRVKIEVLQADARELPFGNSEFDALLSEGMLEHYPEPDRLSMLRTFKHLARRVVIDLPINQRHPGLEEGMGDEFLSGDPQYWSSLFERAGFKVQEEFTRERRRDGAIVRHGWVCV